MWCNYGQSCLHLWATLGAMMSDHEFLAGAVGISPWSTMYILVPMMTYAGELFPMHCFMWWKHLRCMLFAGRVVSMNNDESMLHHVLMDSCQCMGIHCICTFCLGTMHLSSCCPLDHPNVAVTSPSDYTSSWSCNQCRKANAVHKCAQVQSPHKRE